MKQHIVKRWGGFSAVIGTVTVWLFLAGSVHAGPPVESGSTVVVLYNAAVPESKDVATHYAQCRQVPTNQVLGLDLPTGEVMSRADYNTRLMLPVAKWLHENHLVTFAPGCGPVDAPTKAWSVKESSIRYAVLCYGVPLKIDEDRSIVEPEAAKMPIAVWFNQASVDSELAMLPVGFSRVLTGPAISSFYCATNPAVLNPVNGLLMVTRLDGPTAAIARALVDKAMEAETNGLWGRGYFDARGLTNGPLLKGDEWICSAAEYTRRFGYAVVLDTNSATFSPEFPMSQIAFYAGWYEGSVNGPFTRPHVEFMPGAFAYHLFSYSASTIRTNNAVWVPALLAAGATVTMGCVNEPYLDGTPNIGVFFNRWLAPGYSFGEAAYVSMEALSWQATIVGDPLYRPFSRPPQLLHQDLERRQSKLVEWSHARVIGLNLVRGTSIPELVQYILSIPVATHSAVLQETLGDLYEAHHEPIPALAAYQRALENNPTPQQKVRLVFTVGDKLLAAGRDAEAFALWDGFYKETPGFPGALSLSQKLEPLASKLKKSDDAKRYRKEIKRLEAKK